MSGHDTHDDDDDPLDVVELLADDDAPSPPVDDDRPRPIPRRGLLAAGAVALVAIVAVSITVGDDPDDADVGIEQSTTTRGTPRSTPAPRNDPPEIAPGPFVTSVGGRIALTRSGEIFRLDWTRPAFERVRNAGGSGPEVVGAARDSLLVTDGGMYYVVYDDGTVVDGGRGPVLRSADGAGWWRIDADRLSPVGFLTESLALPSGTHPVAALRDGFLLADDASGALQRWVPDTAPVPIDGTRNATIAAVHPDRIAWYGACPEVSCALRVTEPVSGDTVAIPAVMPIFQPGVAAGRFSPDASRLALRVTTGGAGSTELVVVDLATGAVTMREPFDGPRALGTGTTTPYALALPFDFTRDGSRLVLADWSGRQRELVTLDVASGERQPSNDTLRGVTSIVTLDILQPPPPVPLAAPAPLRVDAVIAAREYTLGRLMLTDLATTAQTTVQLGGEDSFAGTAGRDVHYWGPDLVAVRGGFVANTNAYSEFVAFDGTVVPIGPADRIVASTDRARAWVFDRRDDGMYDVASVDGATGAVRTERTVVTVPRVVVGDEFVRAVPASFDAPAQVELYDARTGARRIFDAPGFTDFTSATERYLTWIDDTCGGIGVGDPCTLRVLDVATGAVRAVTVDTGIDFYASPNATAGDVLYLRVPNAHIVRFDLASDAALPVPGSTGAEQWAVGANGTVVFGTATATYAWSPGMTDPVLLAPGNIVSANGLQLAVG